ncbi:ankyrin-1-like [Haliotis rubra]|uniref:ankyrin-1-like n=1 Tax=Haliotis rubra TaxID=36100 RepID=UPI001EE547E7|nr:ankyrin-1-like [Haliotis rubra]
MQWDLTQDQGDIDSRQGEIGRAQQALSQGEGDSIGAHGMTPVLFAAREGYKDVFDFCVCAGGNVSVVDSHGNNILHLASLGGHMPMVKYLVSQNITAINSRGISGRTPVMLAAANGYRYLFDFLVSKGGEASLVDANGKSVLHLASLGGHLDMVKYILSQNFVDIKGKEIYGRTPLMSAAIGGHLDVFRVLMSEGSNASLVDGSGNNILHLASLNGHLDMVKYILSQNIVDINVRGIYEWTPLMSAATGGHLDVFRFLMSEGSNASLVDGSGNNILHLASLNGQLDMVKHIVSQNIVDINVRGRYAWTPLMSAAKRGHLDVFRFLMSEGSNASLVDGSGNNILHLASLNGQLDMVKHIVSQNIVDINVRGRYACTPLMSAATGGHLDVFRFLMSEGSNASLVDGSGNNILHLTSLNGQLDMVKHIVSQNIVDINVRGRYACTPLMVAAKRGYVDVFRFLMSEGSKASLVDGSGNNILHLASLNGQLDMVKHIVSQNIVDINVRGRYACTPLMSAATGGHLDVFRFLMSEGSNASLVDGSGNNILHLTSLNGQLDMVKHIVSQNIVDINVRGRYACTPLMVAAKRGYVDVFRFLMSEGSKASLADASGDNTLHLASRSGHVDIVGCILSQNITDINSRGSFERTPLIFAASSGHRDVFDLLTKRGANVHLVDRSKSNILHVACISGKVKMVKHIISKHIVEINSRGNEGRTVLMMAAEKGNIELVQFIVKEGGNMLLTDDDEENMLHIACHGGHVEMVKYILQESTVDLEATNKYGSTPQKVAREKNNKEVLNYLKGVGERNG